ncbi:hypothetical protein D3C71_1145090 [compost metagenome]
MANKNEAQAGNEKAATYTKEQILESARFTASRDIIAGLLADDRAYSISEVETTIDEFLRKEVK